MESCVWPRAGLVPRTLTSHWRRKMLRWIKWQNSGWEAAPCHPHTPGVRMPGGPTIRGTKKARQGKAGLVKGKDFVWKRTL